MTKVAIVGCGKIADSHAEQIARVPGSSVVAACDRELLMAKQLCERFAVPNAVADLDDVLALKPDAVHITTPPETHFPIAKKCLLAGVHVYVEKPFTITAPETEQLIDLATERNLLLTAGHDLQFSHAAMEMRRLVREGYTGGDPVLMESYYSYDLTDPVYARALLSDPDHWVRKLPGRLLHNVISHGIARVAEFFPSDDPIVIAHGYQSPLLQSLGEEEIVDELRVILSDGAKTSAYFTFSSQIRPSLNLFRIYGGRNGLQLDEDSHTLLKLPGSRFKSYAAKFLPQPLLAAQCMRNLARNLGLFWRRDFHMKSGMKNLIQAFHAAIATGGQPPIPYREILFTARVMDAIFNQLAQGSAPKDRVAQAVQRPETAPAPLARQSA
jgi:predicted dehydrogenase